MTAECEEAWEIEVAAEFIESTYKEEIALRDAEKNEALEWIYYVTWNAELIWEGNPVLPWEIDQDSTLNDWGSDCSYHGILLHSRRSGLH